MLTVEQDGAAYQWNIQVGDQRYPDADPEVFADIAVAEEDTSIRMSLESAQRTDDTDTTVIQMDLINTTDLPVTIID